MSARKKGLRLFLISAVAFALIFCGIQFIQAQQIKTLAKGGKPGKPPKNEVVCNADGICGNEEYVRDIAYGEQPCYDCLPKAYSALSFEKPFILGLDSYPQTKIFQFIYNDEGQYEDVWASDDLGTFIRRAIGDIDNDGVNEVVGFERTSFIEGKGKNKTTKYAHQIYVFEDEALSTPSDTLTIISEEA
jgi:hypothetical protein